MKTAFCACVAVLALFLRIECGVAAETKSGGTSSRESPSTELQALVAQIQSKLDQGKKTQTDVADDLKGFDALLEKYKGQKSDEVAEILQTEARLYLQVFEDFAKSRQLVLQLKRDFPLTTQGRQAQEILNSITKHEEAERIRGFLVTGNQFPDFAEKDTTRNQLTLSAYRGRVILLEFWATWSKASIADVPDLLALYDKHRSHGFEIIGVSLDDDTLKLSAFTARNKMRWPQFCDAASWKNKLAVKYGVNSVPANYLLDTEGKIIAKNLRGVELKEQVAAALGKK